MLVTELAPRLGSDEIRHRPRSLRNRRSEKQERREDVAAGCEVADGARRAQPIPDLVEPARSSGVNRGPRRHPLLQPARPIPTALLQSARAPAGNPWKSVRGSSEIVAQDRLHFGPFRGSSVLRRRVGAQSPLRPQRISRPGLEAGGPGGACADRAARLGRGRAPVAYRDSTPRSAADRLSGRSAGADHRRDHVSQLHDVSDRECDGCDARGVRHTASKRRPSAHLTCSRSKSSRSILARPRFARIRPRWSHSLIR